MLAGIGINQRAGRLRLGVHEAAWFSYDREDREASSHG